jgi:hypothetical protein
MGKITFLYRQVQPVFRGGTGCKKPWCQLNLRGTTVRLTIRLADTRAGCPDVEPYGKKINLEISGAHLNTVVPRNKLTNNWGKLKEQLHDFIWLT